MNIDFLESIWTLKKISYVFQNTDFGKNYSWGYSRATVGSIPRKIIVRNMESWHKNIFTIT